VLFLDCGLLRAGGLVFGARGVDLLSCGVFSDRSHVTLSGRRTSCRAELRVASRRLAAERLIDLAEEYCEGSFDNLIDGHCATVVVVEVRVDRMQVSHCRLALGEVVAVSTHRTGRSSVNGAGIGMPC
jgi:hypothetical protein